MKKALILVLVLMASQAVADTINPMTGEYIVEMNDGGDTYNTKTGAYIIRANAKRYYRGDDSVLVGGDYYNTQTGEYIMEIGDGDYYNTKTGDFILRLDF